MRRVGLCFSNPTKNRNNPSGVSVYSAYPIGGVRLCMTEGHKAGDEFVKLGVSCVGRTVKKLAA